MDLRRELAIVNEGFEEYHQLLGETVAWYQYDRDDSVMHPVYDEGGGLLWRYPVLVPVLWVSFNESTKAVSPDGREQFAGIHFAVGSLTLRRVGIETAGDYEPHLNDLVLYRGRFHEVSEFKPHGRLRGDVIVGVSAAETKLDMQHLPDIVPVLL